MNGRTNGHAATSDETEAIYQLAAEQQLMRALLAAILIGAVTHVPLTIESVEEQMHAFLEASNPHEGLDNDRPRLLALDRIAEYFATVREGMSALSNATEGRPH
jgi:hypothetical protein